MTLSFGGIALRKIGVVFSILCLVFLTFFQPTSSANQTVQPFSLKVEVSPKASQTEFQLTLKNTGKQRQEYIFSTSQFFEIQVIDLKKNQTLYTYSANKAFLQALQKLVLQPGEEKKWKDLWEYSKGVVPEGDVLVKVTLLAKSINKVPLTLENRSVVKKVAYPSQHPMFKNVTVKQTFNGYAIEGSVTTNSGIYFTLDDGHRVFIEEKKIPVRSNHFTILVPYKEIPQNAKGTLLLTIYSKKYDPPYAIELDM